MANPFDGPITPRSHSPQAHHDNISVELTPKGAKQCGKTWLAPGNSKLDQTFVQQ